NDRFGPARDRDRSDDADAGARHGRPEKARLAPGRLRSEDTSPMNWTGTARTIVVCAILIVLHYTLRPLLAWRASIDFLIVALLLGAVRLRPGAAAVYGFMLGLVSDSLAVNGFGAAALGMSIVGFTTSWLKAVFFADNMALIGFFLFVSKWLFDLIFMITSPGASAGSLALP